MREIPTAYHTLGLQLSTSSIKGAELILRKNIPQLIETFEVNVKPLYIGDEQNKLKTLLSKTLTITCLETSEVLARTLELELTKENDIDAVLEFQAEPLLPYPTNEGLIDRIIVEKETEGTSLTVVAARKDFVAKHLERWHEYGVEPETISCIPAALAEFSKYFCPIDTAHLVVYFGEDSTTFALVKSGKLLSAQSLNFGTNDLMKAFSENTHITPNAILGTFSKLDFAEFDREHYPKLTAAINGFTLEVAKNSMSLIKKFQEYEVSNVFATGEGATLLNFVKVIYQNQKLTPLQPLVKSEFQTTPETLHKYAIPIGAALSGLHGNNNGINFRQNEYSYPHPWKRLQKPLIAYFSLCIGVALSIYLVGNAYVAKQDDNLRTEYVHLLASMKKPYSQFETEFLEATQPNKKPETAKVDILSLSQNDILYRLDFLKKELNSTPDMFPLLPNIPRVTDVLAWLSNLPAVKAASESSEIEDSKIQLTSFSYKMMKRPEFNKKKEPYQAKVELEFTTAVPRNAREFHDALLEPNNFVDPTGEVKWNAERGKYRVSFFLKDKTYYPSKSGGSSV